MFQPVHQPRPNYHHTSSYRTTPTHHLTSAMGSQDSLAHFRMVAILLLMMVPVTVRVITVRSMVTALPAMNLLLRAQVPESVGCCSQIFLLNAKETANPNKMTRFKSSSKHSGRVSIFPRRPLQIFLLSYIVFIENGTGYALTTALDDFRQD